MVHINKLSPIHNIRKPRTGDGKRQYKNNEDELKTSDNHNEIPKKNSNKIVDEKV